MGDNISLQTSHHIYYFSNLFLTNELKSDFSNYHSLNLYYQKKNLEILFSPDYYSFFDYTEYNNIQPILSSSFILFSNKKSQLKISNDFSFIHYFKNKNYNSSEFFLQLLFTHIPNSILQMRFSFLYKNQDFDYYNQWDNRQAGVSMQFMAVKDLYHIAINTFFQQKSYDRPDIFSPRKGPYMRKNNSEQIGLIKTSAEISFYLPKDWDYSASVLFRHVNQRTPLWNYNERTFSAVQKWDDEFASSEMSVSQEVSHLSLDQKELKFVFKAGKKHYGLENSSALIFRSPKEREDSFLSFSLNLSNRQYLFNKEVFPFISISYSRNYSNIDFFDYSSFFTSIGLTIYY